ncbi:MAG: hypothetical protein UZ19_OD1000276 [Parcubacteria bacterium OLB19]|nr:MAG: hypothetical protein UZ19_OD1000276 [Parcubacteria bacterium OLB19]
MNKTLGVIGILGIWLTMAMMPLSELLLLSGTEATLLRGLSGLVIIAFFGFIYKRINNSTR